MANPVELLKRAAAVFDERVAAIAQDQWTLQTPCSEWDVRALIHHLVYEDRWAVPLIGGSTIEQVGDRFEGELLGDDPKAAWSHASDAALEAASAPGVVDRQVHVSWGQIPGSEYLMQLFSDHLVHAWDLAVAIGGDTSLPPDLVDECYEFAKPQAAAFAASGAFAEPLDTPDGADAQTVLLAFYGRRA